MQLNLSKTLTLIKRGCWPYAFLTCSFFLIVGCDNKKNGIDSSTETSETVSPSLRIETKMVSESDILNSYEGITDNVLTYIIKSEDESTINVEPNSQYYNLFTSDAEFEIPLTSYLEDEEPTEYVSYPKMNFFITNNSDVPLNISKLNVEVASSSIDNLPYVYIATEEAYSNQLAIANESWKDWGSATLRYKILRKGESFDGNYDKSTTINYKDGIQRIDFTDDLINMGYDYFLLAENVMSEGGNYINLYIDDENLENCKDYFNPFEIGSIYGISYGGFARIHASLKFEDGTSVRFKGKLSLSTPGDFGAGMEENDSFDVILKENGDNYVIEKPYSVSLQPGASDLIGVTFRCDKSTRHSFLVSAENNEGLIVKSKIIKLHLLNPRHSSKNIWQIKKQYID